MSLQRAVAYLRNSLWFLPGLWVVGSGLLAFAMLLVDSATPDLAERFPLLFGGGPDGARSVLSSIATSTITVAGVTFSITVVALQLASSQFSPRVLRNFMRDRVSQVVLGSFIGAFLYSILVLRAIRSERAGTEAFVPSAAVSVAILLAIVAVAMLVYFIHHISSQIQVSTIVARIANETVGAVEVEWREGEHTPAAGEGRGQARAPSEEPKRLDAQRSGYLQLVDRQGLLRVAEDLDIVIRLEHHAGAWVQSGAPLFSVWPAAAGSRELADRLAQQVTLGSQRSLEQDAAFGIRQLVDVAIKALSPGINDPTSAIDCINRLTQILVATGIRREPPAVQVDQDGRPRLVLTPQPYDELVALAFDEIRHYGGTTPAIVRALAEAIEAIGAATPGKRHGPLRRQLQLLNEQAARIEPAGDRRAAMSHMAGILD